MKDGFALIFALECGTLRRRESNHETIYLLDRCNAVLMMCSGVRADHVDTAEKPLARGGGPVVLDIGHHVGAGWLNACDAAGISAIVTETVYVNNRGHAQFLRSEAGARMLAETIAQGVIDWLKTQPHSAR